MKKLYIIVFALLIIAIVAFAVIRASRIGDGNTPNQNNVYIDGDKASNIAHFVTNINKAMLFGGDIKQDLRSFCKISGCNDKDIKNYNIKGFFKLLSVVDAVYLSEMKCAGLNVALRFEVLKSVDYEDNLPVLKKLKCLQTQIELQNIQNAINIAQKIIISGNICNKSIEILNQMIIDLESMNKINNLILM